MQLAFFIYIDKNLVRDVRCEFVDILNFQISTHSEKLSMNRTLTHIGDPLSSGQYENLALLNCLKLHTLIAANPQ